jgi:hypothetical protein
MTPPLRLIENEGDIAEMRELVQDNTISARGRSNRHIQKLGEEASLIKILVIFCSVALLIVFSSLYLWTCLNLSSKTNSRNHPSDVGNNSRRKNAMSTNQH